MRYDGEEANSYTGGNKDFTSEYAKECQKIGAKYLATRAKAAKKGEDV